MKNLGEIIIRDRTLKNECDAIVVQYIYSMIRNKELSRITLNKSFRDAKKELENAHIGIDAMTCDESVVRQVLKSKAEKYIADRKNVILLREKCKDLPSLGEINSLDFTDRVHLILQAHRYYKYVQLDEMLFEEENIVIYLDTWIEQFWNGTVNLRKIKSNLRPVFHRMFGQEGKYFYGLHFKRNKSLDGYVLSLLASCGKGDNKNKKYKALTEFFARVLYEGGSIYEVKNGLNKMDPVEIGVEDFVVRCNVFRCMNKSHEIKDMIGLIKICDENGQNHLMKVPVGYCSECKVYFILNTTYYQLIKNGDILCKIIDEKTYLKSDGLQRARLALQSVLMQYGYNVSQNDGLTDEHRQRILAFIIDNNILSKSEIISYLNFFISQKQKMDNMKWAIMKWNRDREFVEKYKNDEGIKVKIGAIQKQRR